MPFCHEKISPGIVGDWLTSRHASTTPSEAVAKPFNEQRISLPAQAGTIEMDIAVGCMECHGVGSDNRPDSFSHMGYTIHTVVTPNDCARCHSVEVEQYSGSKKAHAVGNLRENPVYSLLVAESISLRSVEGDELVLSRPSGATESETCFACHGTNIEIGETIQKRTRVGTAKMPALENWPNQGVGRVNPDGSLGSCTSCHPRHGFSIEVARSPETCGQCHLEPDVPAYNVYKESKHGNIFDARRSNFDMSAVPWVPGEDFYSPTCASCHVSLLVTPDGEKIANRSHDFGSRLWVRIFGLTTSHPQPIDGQTSKIRNSDGQPLPTTFAGAPAEQYLIDGEEQNRRKDTMAGLCSSCHSSNWIRGYMARLEVAIENADKMVIAATDLMDLAWNRSIADPSNPFDESLEHLWIAQWLFYANSVRYAAAMMGPDYGTFKNGWWYLSTNIDKMHGYVDDGD